MGIMSKFLTQKWYKIMKDKETIKKLGGSAVLARFLKKNYSTVHNWTVRGIPAKYKLDYPHLFQTDNPPNLKATQNKTP